MVGSWPSAGLYSVEPTTGQTTLVGNPPFDVVAMASSRGRLFGIAFDARAPALYDIDRSTAELTEVLALPGLDSYSSLAMGFDASGILWIVEITSVPIGPPPTIYRVFRLDIESGELTQVAEEFRACCPPYFRSLVLSAPGGVVAVPGLDATGMVVFSLLLLAAGLATARSFRRSNRG